MLVVTTFQYEPRRTKKRYGGRSRIKELCKDKIFNEFCRDQTKSCAKVVKCDTSRTGLSTLTCSAPLVFDIDTQICNYEERVGCITVTELTGCLSAQGMRGTTLSV